MSGGVECGGCLRRYSRAGWESLPLVRTLTRGELAQYVVRWHEARAIEVRRCASCDREMARVSATAALAPTAPPAR
jgi:hypothetical protein